MHLLLKNLSNVTNRIRASASWQGAALGARLVTLPPMGARLLDVTTLAPFGPGGVAVRRLRLEGNAWFNLYVVGAGPRGLAGPLSLMHVK
jgi:threonine dehydrogenase-like Zn-dependent dehydrogenase